MHRSISVANYSHKCLVLIRTRATCSMLPSDISTRPQLLFRRAELNSTAYCLRHTKGNLDNKDISRPRKLLKYSDISAVLCFHGKLLLKEMMEKVCPFLYYIAIKVYCWRCNFKFDSVSYYTKEDGERKTLGTHIRW